MFPTADQWRAAAAHARKMADEYRAEGNSEDAERRASEADFYERQAVAEEWLLARRAPINMGEAA